MNGGAGVQLEPGDRVLVTGASGFIGSAITRLLVEQKVRVVALVESDPQGQPSNLDGLDVECVFGDVRDPGAVDRASQHCRAVFHTAALYRFSPKRALPFYDVNVGGTRNVLAAAARSGCERVVYTGSVSTLGLHDGNGGGLADERSYADLDHLFGAYKQSKYVAEHEVLRAAAEGIPVTLVLPTFPLGPGDRRPTPTGKFVLDFLNGRMPGYADTAMNVVHVDDVARGHLLALELGANGRSYVLGSENVSMDRLVEMLASCTGLPAPARRIPRPVVLGAGFVSEMVEGRILGRQPMIPLEAARMATTHMVFDDNRARLELGYRPRPAIEAVESSARWFVQNGYVRPSRRARIIWAEGDRA
jgi:dihydroflavonol-4-reductase